MSRNPLRRRNLFCALWFATGRFFQAEVASVRLWLGGSAEAHR